MKVDIREACGSWCTCVKYDINKALEDAKNKLQEEEDMKYAAWLSREDEQKIDEMLVEGEYVSRGLEKVKVVDDGFLSDLIQAASEQMMFLEAEKVKKYR